MADTELQSLLMARPCLPLRIPCAELSTDVPHPPPPLPCSRLTGRAFHPLKDVCHARHLLHTGMDQPDFLILDSN